MPRRIWSDRITLLLLAAVAYLPLLRTKREIIGADTKHYLYLDPDRLMTRAASVWDPSIGLGTVSHQNVGYLWPMGPWYRFFESVGVEDWIAQRLWLATVLFAAGAGVMFLLRQLGIRGLGATVAAFSYMLSPYVLAYAARISAILLPWAGLPWLIGIFIMATRRGGWRWPALFALVVTTIGSINASSLVFAGLAVLLWLPFAIWHLQEIDVRAAGRVLGRVGILTAVTQVWWLVALMLSSWFGPPVLETTESLEAVSTSSVSTEVVRSLGNWFFYGRDALGPWVQASVPYTQEGWLIAVSFTLPVLAFAAVAIMRWQHRAYFSTLIVVGALIGIASFPYDDPSPFGALNRSLAESSTLALAMRNAQRALPLLALGVAVLLGAGVHAIGDRIPWGRVLSAAPLLLLIFANQPALWNGTLVDENLQRPQELPTFVTEAAEHLDSTADGTRVLELPGSDFAAHRWGNTVDPVLPGLIDRPWVGRESAPQGTSGSINLVNALDRRLQEGIFEPTTLAPVARLMNASEVVIRGDLQTERYRTPRPEALAAAFDPLPAGLREPVEFGAGFQNTPSAELPLLDELALGFPPDAPTPAAITVYPVTGARPIVSTRAGNSQVILSGDGDGIVDASAAGLVEGDELVFYSGDLGGLAPELNGIVFDPDAHVIITDTNRRRAERYTGLRENLGYTEVADEEPLRNDPGDARLPLFTERPDDDDPQKTVTLLEGVRSIRATGYGNILTYIPEERPAAAFDGDITTAWKVAAFGSPVGERLLVEFEEALTVDQLTLLQPVVGDRNRFITEILVRFDDGSEIRTALDETSRTDPGQTVTFPSRTTGSLEIEILADSAGSRAGGFEGLSAVGFANISIPGVSVRERVRLPTDVIARAGGHSGPLSVVMTRLRVNPAERVRDDPEQALERVFTLPDTPTNFDSYEMTGVARLSGDAPDDLIDQVLGRRGAGAGGVTAKSSSRLPGSLTARAASALDGDPETAWTPEFGEQEGQFVQFEFGRRITTEHLDLQVLADGRHSVPTEVRLTNELGEELDVAVPPVASSPVPGTTQTVRVDLDENFSFQQLRLTVTGVEPFTTIDYFSRHLIVLPIGIAELGLSRGETVPSLDTELASTCRNGLIRLNGEDTGIRINSSTAAALDGAALPFEGCDAAMTLEAGEHSLSSTPGERTGFDVDRVVIDRLLPEEAVDPETTVDRGPPVTSVRSGRSGFDLSVRDAEDPFFLVMGESFSDAWDADADAGVSTGDPIRANGFATTWYVDPTQAADAAFDMTITWTPQAWAARAQLFSLVAVAACIFLLLTGRRAEDDVELSHLPPALDPTPTFSLAWDRPGRVIELVPTVAISLLIGVVGSFVISPEVGPLLACLSIALGLRPVWRAVLPVGAVLLLAAGGLATIVVQMWKQYPPGFNWASNFEPLHVAGLVALAFLALNAGLEVVAARSAPPAHDPARASRTSSMPGRADDARP